MMIMLAFAQAVASDQQQIMQILLAHQRRQQDLFIALGIALGFHTGLSIYRLVKKPPVDKSEILPK
jgi:hypothetical protein